MATWILVIGMGWETRPVVVDYYYDKVVCEEAADAYKKAFRTKKAVCIAGPKEVLS